MFTILERRHLHGLRTLSCETKKVKILWRSYPKISLTDAELKILSDKGLIEGRKSNVILSAQVVQTIGQKAIYSRQKAFVKQSYFDWIIEAIKHHSSVSRKDIEVLFWDKLSDL